MYVLDEILEDALSKSGTYTFKNGTFFDGLELLSTQVNFDATA